MSMRKYLKDACETVDAAVFSGDVLYSDDERTELKTYVERWVRVIAEHEQSETPETHDEQARPIPPQDPCPARRS